MEEGILSRPVIGFDGVAASTAARIEAGVGDEAKNSRRLHREEISLHHLVTGSGGVAAAAAACTFAGDEDGAK